MKTPHKHAALIKVWADGAEIEETYAGQSGDDGWHTFDGNWDKPCTSFRVKPEPKPDVVFHCHMDQRGFDSLTEQFVGGDNLKLTFSGETGRLIKAEVI